MAYRLRYQVYVDWVPPGLGLGQNAAGGPGVAPAGPAQTLGFFNSQTGTTAIAVGTTAAGTTLPPNSTTFLTADVLNLTNAMAADIYNQMNQSGILTRVQNFSSGNG